MDRAMLVASPGGHLDELLDLLPRLPAVGAERLWVTARTPQSAQSLVDENTTWVRPIASRQGGRALARLPGAVALVRKYHPNLVISTGAALATPYLIAARMLGIETHYIESATRLDGPSLTGRIMARVPGTRLHHQGLRSWETRWHSVGSVFDAYAPGCSTQRQIRRAVVTLGTERYPFPRALETIGRALPPGAEVLYQHGHTEVPVPDPSYRRWVPLDELLGEIAAADLVVTHAGVGSILAVLRTGKHPVVIPRLAALGEHCDDHQLDLARFLQARGLVTGAEPDSDLAPLLRQVVGRTTKRTELAAIEL